MCHDVSTHFPPLAIGVSTPWATACAGSAKAQLSLGTSRLAAADEAGARRAFRRALAIHADYPDALYWLGRLALQRGELLQAKEGMHGTCMHVHVRMHVHMMRVT